MKMILEKCAARAYPSGKTLRYTMMKIKVNLLPGADFQSGPPGKTSLWYYQNILYPKSAFSLDWCFPTDWKRLNE